MATCLALFGARELVRERVLLDSDAVLDRAQITVDTWFDRYSAFPQLYARDPAIRFALSRIPQAGGLNEINRKLSAWNEIAGTSDTYLLDRSGTAVAASNWQKKRSFVGENYGFRPYYTEAIAGRDGGFFGLGTVSGQRGYYLSSPVQHDGEILGVVVVKLSVEALEEALDYSPHIAFVTDAPGVAIVSGHPAVRMTQVDVLKPDDLQQIVSTRKYDLNFIDPAPLNTFDDWSGTPVLTLGNDSGADVSGSIYLDRTRMLPREDWTLHLLYDLSAYSRLLWSIGIAILASAVAILALALLGLQRRQSLIDRLADRERDRAELARRIQLRTRELTATNAQLEDEVNERRAAEATLRQTQDELVQAGKLAALGQMSAALSHEFNQPLTAIRTYTENAVAFYDQGQPARAGENLNRVLRLTEKVAQLSKHLTRFARRSGHDVKRVDLDAVIEEALGLLAARVKRSEAEVRVTGDKGAMVLGGATRLQHVLMNLISNAIDAAREDTKPEIEIAVSDRSDTVEIAIIDNGTGIAPETLPKIFDPFFTTKEVGHGLGLGLSICFNIIEDFGGVLRAANRPQGGARMIVVLRAAQTVEVAAE